MIKSHVLVVGDIRTDLLIYPTLNQSSKQHTQPKFHARICYGGAKLITDLLREALPDNEYQVHGPTVSLPQQGFQKPTYNAISELEPFSGDPLRFKVKRRQHIFVEPKWRYPTLKAGESSNTSVLVFQDADSDFSNVDDVLNFLRGCRSQWLLYCVTRRPLGTGPIWDYIRHGPNVTENTQDAERLIFVVRAEDLRAEGIGLSYGLSWEKTCESFVENLGSNGKLDTIVTSANLIVLIGCDGAIYHRGRQMAEPILFFDPPSQEGQFTEKIGSFPGLFEAFVGGLAAKIAEASDDPFIEGIRFGLQVARRLAKLGFASGLEGPRYPVKDIINPPPDEMLESLHIPSQKISQGDNRSWSILHHNIGDPVQVAHQIVSKGLQSATAWVPTARFGRLTALDRWEIEAFRTIYNAICEYLSSPQTKPLNIGVFGSSGSGKSFAAVQVATAAAERRGRQIRHIRIDLTQFSSPRDLCVALNAVRDCSLSGILPIVYIKGFDAALSSNPLGWLIHLLPPMHAGQVFDQGEMRHIGSAVFLHGSSTTATLEDFSEPGVGGPLLRRRSLITWKDEMASGDEEVERYVPKHGNNSLNQDFLSCLHAFVNVLGLNPVNPEDVLYRVRRAVILRALLEEREPLLKSANSISVDESILHGLLLVKQLRYGIRSLRTIINMSKVTGKRHFEKAALPPRMQLSLHLDYNEFAECCHYSILPERVVNTIAKILHEKYLECRRDMAKNADDLKEVEAQESFKPWHSLDEEYKNSARKQAIDIPRKLSTISCFLAETRDDRTAIEEFEIGQVEKLAELEHERFNAERLQNQWHLGERNEKKRANPFLKPWRDLEEEWRNIDRQMVMAYIGAMPETYKIYRTGKVATATTFETLNRRRSADTMLQKLHQKG